MLSPDDGVKACVDPHAVLSKLAHVLNCPVESFFDSTHHELSQTVKLLNLWAAIETPQDREKLLAMARVLTSIS